MKTQNMEVNEKEVFENKYWIINKISLKLIGLWPYQKSYTKIWIRTVILLATHSILLPLIIRMVNEWGNNFEIVCENITGFFYFQAIVCKYVTNFMAEPQLQYLYERITEDWKTFTNEDERKVLERSASYGRFLTIGYMECIFLLLNTESFFPHKSSIYTIWNIPSILLVCLNICGVGFSITPALYPALLDLISPLNQSREKFLCVKAEYFIDQQEHYYILLFHTVTCALCSVQLFSIIDSAYVNCVQHVLGLFGLVDLNLNKAFKITQLESILEKDEKKIHDYVLKSIVLHDKAIKFVDLLQTTYTNIFFLTTAATLCALSFGTFVVMISSADYFNFVRLLLVWLGIIMYLFYVSAPGQRITDTSSSISESIFYCGWHDFPLETQKLIRFMILRCSVPCQFTAGPLFVMNIENCGVILRSAMSYCTVVAATTKD